MFIAGLAVMSVDFGSEFMKIAIVKVRFFTTFGIFKVNLLCIVWIIIKTQFNLNIDNFFKLCFVNLFYSGCFIC